MFLLDVNVICSLFNSSSLLLGFCHRFSLLSLNNPEMMSLQPSVHGRSFQLL